tara:strand:+ start:1101 stop:1472 length:372 start_codon:yes stop_codon:yes gene_type:complete
MPNEHDKEHRPIEDESSVVEQSLGVAIGILDSVIAEYPDVIDIDDLKEIMTHLEDAYEALDIPSEDEKQAEHEADIKELARVVELHELRAELKAEQEAERQADAQAELQAEACYGDDLEGGWY